MHVDEKITADYVIAAVFFIVAAYAYWEARSFSSNTDLWPKILSAIIIVLSLLLLMRKFLPSILKDLMSESGEVIKIDEDLTQSDNEDMQKHVGVNRPLDDAVFTVLSIIGYIILSYLFGMLWASPAFVLVYMLWFNIRLILVTIMSIISFLIGYGFMKLLFLPLDQGILFGGI